MTDQGLADRLLSYADALVAAAFLGMSATGIALGDPAIRCEFARVPIAIAGLNLLSGSALTLMLVGMRRCEFNPRSTSPPSALAARYAQHLHTARRILIWAFVLGMAGLVFAATKDDACLVMPGAAP